jgi:large subunit ribosomal protein L4e
MATRKVVNVQSLKVDNQEASKVESVRLPAVFSAPIRADIVHFVHTNMAKNKRQPYAVFKDAGKQHSAESWGTGRAVARVPRISGGGTKRSGEGAFGNMCRQGRMAAPTKVWRRWHRMLSVQQRRYAVCAALAASAVPALVMARGHRVEQVPEIPLVLPASFETVEKTKQALAALQTVHADEDIAKAKQSKHVRSGIGKLRNRRYTARRGPLLIYAADACPLRRAARNLPGVELCNVDRLNLLQLAPGGHVGRFVVWTKPAFERLTALYGTQRTGATLKHGYHMPRPLMTNADLSRLINSDEIQSVCRPAQPQVRQYARHKNPLANRQLLEKLNPYAASVRKIETARQKSQQKKRNASAKVPQAEVKRRKVLAKHARTTYARLAAESAYDESSAIRTVM